MIIISYGKGAIQSLCYKLSIDFVVYVQKKKQCAVKDYLQIQAQNALILSNTPPSHP